MLSISLGGLGWFGQYRLNRFAKDREQQRLTATAAQVAGTLGATLGRVKAELARLAASPEMRLAVAPMASAGDRASAQRSVAAYHARSAQFLSVAVWSVDGRVIAKAGDDALAASRRPRPRTAGQPSDGPVVIGPLAMQGDTALYSATATIGEDSRAAGYVVVTRRFASNAEGAALYGSLIGPDARLMLANAGESVTIGFARGAGVEIPAGSAVGEYEPPGGLRFYARAAVPDAPWQLLVDEPRHQALAPMRRFALGMLGAAALFILVSATVIWVMIRRFLAPLDAVTHAVVGFADGDGGERVPVSGDDEIARLGRAFNRMADRVESRTDSLMQLMHDQEESERRYRALVDQLPDGILVHRNRKVVFVNPACALLLGEREPAALVNRPILDFVEPSEHELTLRRLDHVAEGGRVPPRELRLRRVDGLAVLVESTNMPLVLDGEPAIQTILHDVTDRHVLEDRLRQSQKLEAVGRLAGGIAHDFNNILTVIDAHADFALGRTKQDEVSADIEEIRRASASAAKLTRQLLAFSRKQGASPTAVDLGAAVRDLTVMLRRLLGDDIAITSKLADSLWPVFIDETQLQQVLLNLALNARDAMPLGGTLTFRTTNMEVGPEYRSASGETIPAGDYVVLTVEDTGAGMPPEVASRVFEPFFTTKGTGRGTGLGLAMVYGIVKQAGGYIWVYSEPGEGTSFRIMLPRHVDGLTRNTDDARRGEPLERIAGDALLVEDQPDVRAAVARSLREAGLTVTAVRDATAALQVLERGEHLDVLITDVVMPGLSGTELAEIVADRRPDLPVILLSGYSEELVSRQRPLPARCRFLEKPVNMRVLLRAVRELRAGESDVTDGSRRFRTSP